MSLVSVAWQLVSPAKQFSSMPFLRKHVANFFDRDSHDACWCQSLCVCMCMEDVDGCRACRCEPPELLDSEPYHVKCDWLAQFRKVQL